MYLVGTPKTKILFNPPLNDTINVKTTMELMKRYTGV